MTTFCVLRLCSEARAGFVDGVASLLGTVKTERCSDTERLVRRHIARFMAAAEELDRGEAARTPLPSGASNASPSPDSGAGTRPAPALAAADVEMEAVQYRAMWLERRARAAEVSLKFATALKAYTKAAHEFKKLRALSSDMPEMARWAGERALSMVEGAERIQRLLLRQDPPARPIPAKRASMGGTGMAGAEEAAVAQAPRPASTPSAPSSASAGGKPGDPGPAHRSHQADDAAAGLPLCRTVSREEGGQGLGFAQDLERECCICLESFPRDKLLGICSLCSPARFPSPLSRLRERSPLPPMHGARKSSDRMDVQTEEY